MEHSLKTWPEHYQPIANGNKTVELRLNDRSYQVGDTLLLKEWEPIESGYTGRELRVRVTHILRGGEWLTPGYVCMSIKHCVSSNGAESALASAEGTQEDRCPRCGLPLDNISPGISVIAGGTRICTSCLNPGEKEIARARGL